VKYKGLTIWSTLFFVCGKECCFTSRCEPLSLVLAMAYMDSYSGSVFAVF
jgi:hypothetical protein